MYILKSVYLNRTPHLNLKNKFFIAIIGSRGCKKSQKKIGRFFLRNVPEQNYLYAMR